MPKKCILNKTNVVCEHCILICFHFDIYLFFLAKIILILSLSLFVSECLSNGDFSLYVDEWLLVYVIISLNMLDIVPSFICGFLTSDSMFDSQNVFLSFLFCACFTLTIFNDDHDLVIWFRQFYRRKEKHTFTKPQPHASEWYAFMKTQSYMYIHIVEIHK